MKLPRTTAATFVVSLLLSSGALAKPNAVTENPSAERLARAEALVAPLAARYPALSVTVYKAGKVVWSRHSGYADAAGTVAVDAKTRFNIYSTAKTITGLAFARLSDRGEVPLDKSVTQIDPTLPARYDAITPRRLLSHTSGLRHYRSPADWLAFSNRRCASPQAALDYFTGDELDFEPGARQQYSSFGFVLLSHVLLKTTGGRDFEKTLNRSLGPWARFTLDHDGATKAQPYVLASQSPTPVTGVAADAPVPLQGLSAECKFGAGGLLASSAQLARVGAALADGEIVPIPHLATFLAAKDQENAVAFGMAIGKTTTPVGVFTTVNQSGAAPGGRSYLFVLIEPRVSVAIAGNLDGSDLSKAAKELGKLWIEAGDAP